jgi:ATP-binding cassette subfamily G (WHITE) protein 2 (PDR)
MSLCRLPKQISTDDLAASMICDLPNKIGTATVFNLALYFMTNLRRTPGHFFVFYLFTFMCTLTISMYFRSIGALSRTLSQASSSIKAVFARI